MTPIPSAWKDTCDPESDEDDRVGDGTGAADGRRITTAIVLPAAQQRGMARERIETTHDLVLDFQERLLSA